MPSRSSLSRRRRGAVLPLSLALVLTTLAVSTVRAQEDLERHGIFLDSVDVNLVNVEVVAVDEEGDPVRDLTREDFTVYEDGRPVQVTNFFAVEHGVRREGEEMVAEAEAVPLPRLDEERYVVVFVDNVNIAPNHRQRVFTELIDELDALMQPADWVLVASQERGVEIVQPFTRDRALVEAAALRIQRETAAAGMRTANLRQIERVIEGAQQPQFGTGGGGDGVGLLSSGATPTDEAISTMADVQSYAGQTMNQLQQTLGALDQFVGSLSGLPGRKAVVYVSDGIELRPGERLFRLWEDKFRLVQAAAGVGSVDLEMERYSLENELRRVIANANSNRVAFYTVEGGNDAASGAASAETRSVQTSASARTADGRRQASMLQLANETGGTALTGGAPVGAILARLDRDFSNYYSLGYPSPNRGDGEYHEVKVEVSRPGVRLRYLSGYRDKNEDERMTDSTLASLLFDVGDNPLDVRVELGEQTKEKKGDQFVVPVMVKIPLSKLVLIPQQGAHLGQLSIFVAVRDDQGRMSAPQKIEVPVQIPNDQLLTAMSQTAGYLAQLRMRPGEQKIAVGVRDELAASTSSLNLNVDVGQ